MIVGRSTNQAIGRLVGMARALGDNRLDARVGDLHASPELQLLAGALDQAAARLDAAIEAERQVEAERRDLITSMSHDLRTPLANLRSTVEAINDGVVDDPETVRRYAAEMLRSIMALVELVEDLFELTQVDTASFAEDSRMIPLAAAVQRADRPVLRHGGCRHGRGWTPSSAMRPGRPARRSSPGSSTR